MTLLPCCRMRNIKGCKGIYTQPKKRTKPQNCVCKTTEFEKLLILTSRDWKCTECEKRIDNSSAYT